MSSKNNRLAAGKRKSVWERQCNAVTDLFRRAGVVDENGRMTDEWHRIGTEGVRNEQRQQPPETPETPQA